MIEGTICTATALARADFPSFHIKLDDARRDFPHHKALGILQFVQNRSRQNAELNCLVKLDAARNIVLDVSCHPTSHQMHDSQGRRRAGRAPADEVPLMLGKLAWDPDPAAEVGHGAQAHAAGTSAARADALAPATAVRLAAPAFRPWYAELPCFLRKSRWKRNLRPWPLRGPVEDDRGDSLASQESTHPRSGDRETRPK